MWIEPETFEPVKDALGKSGYEPFSSPGDRHGSWEWTFCRKSGDMTRFVILAATPVNRGNTLEVEFWIGAEADQRFARLRAESLQVSPQNLALMQEHLVAGVKHAINAANSLGLSDLTERYAFRAQAVSARHF
jgi:hypothetical protein